MSELFKWLSTNPIAAITIIISFGVLVISGVIVYLVAFFQGREISFWPPKIGAKEHEKKQATTLDKKIDPVNQGYRLVYRDDLPDIGTFIDEAREEIWLNGIDLNIIVNELHKFVEKAQKGIKIKFLAINLDEHIIQETGEFRAIEPNRLAGRMKANFGIIFENLIQVYPDKVEFRVMKHRPSLAYFIIDPYNKEHGKMNVLAYMYHAFAINEPFLHITKKFDESWFEVYLKDFETMWKDSLVLSQDSFVS